MEAIATWKIREISSHPSYHGAISGSKAEVRLKQQDKICYLTRYSEANEGFTLSVLGRKNDDWVIQNFKICISNTKDDHCVYEIPGAEVEFGDIASLLNYYKDNPLNQFIDCIGNEVVSDRKIPGRNTTLTTRQDKAENGEEIIYIDTVMHVLN